MILRKNIYIAPMALVILLASCSKSSDKPAAEEGEVSFGAVQSEIRDDSKKSEGLFPSLIPSGRDSSPPPLSSPTSPSPSYPAPTIERTTTETRQTSVGGLVTTKTTRKTTERVALPMPTLPPVVERPISIMRRQNQQQIQSGMLTAGEYDDLLNPQAYATYASNTLQTFDRQLPFVDTRTRISIKTLGSDGQPVPFARVTIQRKGKSLSLMSAADGTVSFYPGFDRISGKTKVTISSTAGRAETIVNVAKGPQNIIVPLSEVAPPVQALDIAIVIDTTGSMGDEINYLQAELDSIVERIRRNSGNIDIRVGVVAYRDEGDDYVVKSFGISNPQIARNSLASLNAGGGGDSPEAMDKAIASASQLPWRKDAVKTMLLVADAPPHDDKLAGTLENALILRERGIHIVPIAASGVDDMAEYVMRTMSAMTQGRYLFLTDDSGIGNPHGEPQISCYLVTRLDGLVARVISSLVTGRRVEPRREDIIREVGQYNYGRCSGEDGVRGQE